LVARLGAIIWIWTPPVEANVQRAVIAYPHVLPTLKSQIKRLRSVVKIRLSVRVSITNHQQTSKEENLCSFRIHEQDISTRSRTTASLGMEDTGDTRDTRDTGDMEGMDMDGMERNQTRRRNKCQTRKRSQFRRLRLRRA
jgi:hypothetical protein